MRPAAFQRAAVDPEHLAPERRAERACQVAVAVPDSSARLRLVVLPAVAAVVERAAVVVVEQTHPKR